MSPYLIIDQTMMTALTFAAKRGVDVKLILPHIPDKKFAFALAKSHYRELITAGVRIFEYTPGFVHAKVFTSDGEKAAVGTINLDYRSLYLHFECAAFLYRVPEIARIEEDFQATLEKCQEIRLGDLKKESLLLRAEGWLLNPPEALQTGVAYAPVFFCAEKWESARFLWKKTRIPRQRLTDYAC